jgi:ribonuclease PH
MFFQVKQRQRRAIGFVQPRPPPTETCPRSANQLRPLRFQNHIAPNATGSTLIEWGNTRVICGVTVEESVPRWMKEQKVKGGWITAEYSMLPYSTLERKAARQQPREKLTGARRKSSGSSAAPCAPRLIWKSSGAHVCVDCDVLQADGGTRTAAITGAFVALSRWR